ncbi:uncharacterized protein C8R40DRAFT_1245731 [Lentinula edodes]|uniref:uncharacterized protein n=1 Tax=Lentinula edodes TaxID=5353 RepID=UPI001E8CC85A|nr:uncharacterized protein C8R40DRAFT_1245731 [Lentinula edodes]KAH7879446.1 hypothetical protein C8R40DRAFT_1245731 [Lentinula edodes]
MKWFSKHFTTILPWPANSSDLSPIENAWHEVQHRVRLQNPNLLNSNQYFDAIKAEWGLRTFRCMLGTCISHSLAAWLLCARMISRGLVIDR